MTTRSVLLLDFDNVFTALWRRDPAEARLFATDAGAWLQRLGGNERRWLVRRCYLNPSGSLPCVEELSGRLHFSRFRPGLVRAGFEVVDCPSLTAGGSNAADIRLVLDAVDLLRADCRYDEFVIASGDSDFAPLLTRLRAHDRRTAIVAAADASAAYAALADEVIDYHAIRATLVSEAAPLSFEALVRSRYEQAASPLCLGRLAQHLMAALPGVQAAKWGGAGSLSAAITALNLPGARIAANRLWDDGRHVPPAGLTPDPSLAEAA